MGGGLIRISSYSFGFARAESLRAPRLRTSASAPNRAEVDGVGVAWHLRDVNGAAMLVFQHVLSELHWGTVRESNPTLSRLLSRVELGREATTEACGDYVTRAVLGAGCSANLVTAGAPPTTDLGAVAECIGVVRRVASCPLSLILARHCIFGLSPRALLSDVARWNSPGPAVARSYQQWSAHPGSRRARATRPVCNNNCCKARPPGVRTHRSFLPRCAMTTAKPGLSTHEAASCATDANPR